MLQRLLFLFTFVVSEYFILVLPGRSSITLNVIHSIIILLSSYFIYEKSEKSFSLFKIYNIFNLFFVGIAPVIQFNSHSSFWGAHYFSKEDYIHTSSIYLLTIVFTIICYKYFYLRKHLKAIGAFFSDNLIMKLTNKKIFLLVILGVLSVFLVLYINAFDLSSVFVRSGEMKLRVGNKMTILLIEHFIRPIPIVLFMYLFCFSKYKTLAIYFLIISFVVANPLAMSRIGASTFYVPVLLTTFAFMRKKNVFVSVFIVGLLIIFPSLNSVRRGGSFSLYLSAAESFAYVDFDSYAIFSDILKHETVTNGYQLLGPLFFWFPRQLWPDKPIGSGSFVAEEYGYYFDNISCNYYAEGFLNFGYFGIVLFAVFLAYAMAILDKYYWSHNLNNKNVGQTTIVYSMIMTSMFLVLRGDLLCSTAYLCGLVFSCLFCKKILS